MFNQSDHPIEKHTWIKSWHQPKSRFWLLQNNGSHNEPTRRNLATPCLRTRVSTLLYYHGTTIDHFYAVPKTKGRKGKASKDAAAASSEEDEESEIEDLLEDPSKAAPPSRPKPRAVYRPAPPEDSETQTDMEDEVVLEPTNATPKSRPRPKATYKTPKSSSISPEKVSRPAANGTPRPKTPGKRSRAVEEERSASDEEDSPAETKATPIHVRKRVRH